MAFLLVKILALILLSGVAGAAIATWWLRRGFEDVTTEYEALQQRTRILEVQRPLLDGMSRRLEALEQTLASPLPEPLGLGTRIAEVDQKLERWSGVQADGQNRMQETVRLLAERVGAQPAVDLAPVLERLASLEEKYTSESQGAMFHVLERLSEIEEKLADLKLADLEHVVAASSAALAGRMDAVGEKADLAPLATRLDTLETRLAAPADTMDRRLASLERTTGELLSSLSGLSSSLSGLGLVDLGGLVPEFEGVRARLDALHTPDVTDLSAAVAGLSSTVAALRVPNFEQMNQRLAAIEKKSAEPDLERVLAHLRALEARLDAFVPRSAPPPFTPSGPDPAPAASPGRDMLNGNRRAAGRNLLHRPLYGAPDNLEIVRGIGPKLTELLHQLGVYYFWQVAEWSADDVAFVDSQLEQFQGRIERDQWVAQCAALAAEPSAARRPA